MLGHSAEKALKSTPCVQSEHKRHLVKGTSTERERVIVSQNPKTFFSVIADSVRAICQMTTPLGGADPKEGIVSARCGGWQPNRCDFKGP